LVLALVLVLILGLGLAHVVPPFEICQTLNKFSICYLIACAHSAGPGTFKISMFWETSFWGNSILLVSKFEISVSKLVGKLRSYIFVDPKT
jgi:hypothetical protein